mmetsp:Transcript_29843/g.75061  ORF Transcript_29843/g.75061 Transcript_29843/m.75061 type:complete len:226 (-) Transcript_29843:342-1019(-)
MRSSNMWNTSELGWWMVKTTVRPPRCARSPRCSMSTAAVSESNPEVGSSRKSSGESLTSSTPMAHRLRSPPEMPRCTPAWPTCVSAALFSRSWSRMSATLSRLACALKRDGGSDISAAKRICSRTVMLYRNTSSCITYEAVCLRSLADTASPFTSKSPVSSRSRLALIRPASTFRALVLPAPLAPMMAVVRPARRRPEMPLSTGITLVALRKRRFRMVRYTSRKT